MKTCLIVIDVQESFRHRPFFRADSLPAYLAAQNALVQGCVAAGVPVVRVLHSDGPEQAGNPFSQASGQVRPLEGLVDFPPPPRSPSRATARWWARGWTCGSPGTASPASS